MFIIFTVTSSQTKLCASQVVSPACTSLGCAMGFALTSDQLHNGQWCGWNLSGGGKSLTMAILIITMFEWVEKTLPYHSGLAPHPNLYMGTSNVLFKGTNCRRQRTAFCQILAKQVQGQECKLYGCPLGSTPCTQSWLKHPSPLVSGHLPLIVPSVSSVLQ